MNLPLTTSSAFMFVLFVVFTSRGYFAVFWSSRDRGVSPGRDVAFPIIPVPYRKIAFSCWNIWRTGC